MRGQLQAVWIALSLGCSPDVDTIPHGTFPIGSAFIPPELDTTAMTATITAKTVTFRYATSNGTEVEVIYQIGDKSNGS